MADFLKEAIDMVKAQASLKEMTPEQTMDLVKKYQQSFLTLANIDNKNLLDGVLSTDSQGLSLTDGSEVKFEIEPKKALKMGQPEKITCAICGKQGRTLSRHLKNAHSLDPKEYKKLCGYPADTKLTAKSFSDKRSDWAKENKPFEKSPQYQKSKETKKSEGKEKTEKK